MGTDELFHQLLPCSWRGLSFPISEVSHELTHDIARHKKTDRDGAKLEATGRNPLVFHVKAIFINGIARGFAENWPDNLYPGQYRKVLAACADRRTGAFQHPELGLIRAKCTRFSDVLRATTRGGVEVDMVFEETTESDDQLKDLLGDASPITKAIAAAADLTTNIDLRKFQKADPNPTLSFTEAVRRIQSAFDQVTLLDKRLGGMIDNVLYRLRVLEQSVDQAADVQNYALLRSIQRLRASMYDIKRHANRRQTSFYVLKTASTLAAVANYLHAKVDDLVKLNPALAALPIIPERTLIRYYPA